MNEDLKDTLQEDTIENNEQTEISPIEEQAQAQAAEASPEDLYNTRPTEKELEQAAKPAKKRSFLRVMAIVLVSVMFGCAVGAAIVLPMAEQLGYIQKKQELPADALPPNPSQIVKNEIDYSNVDYPEVLPEFDGEPVVVKNNYNPVPDIAEQISDSVVLIEVTAKTQDGTPATVRGTGVIISTEGYILTNEHIVSSGGDIVIILSDNERYEGTLMGVDKNIDVAVIRIKAAGLKALKIGDSSKTRVGELAIAVGNPSGAGANLTGTVTVGYISAVQREILFNDTRQKFIQTDVAVNPGNSGGPLVNDRGEVIGLVTLKSLVSSVDNSGSTISAEGLGFAIPVDTAMTSAKQIILGGDVVRPGLGIMAAQVDKVTFGADGLYIDSFIKGSLAEAAGLKVGDIITHCDGIRVTTLEGLGEILGGKYAGDTVRITVLRNGTQEDFDIELTDMNKL